MIITYIYRAPLKARIYPSSTGIGSRWRLNCTSFVRNQSSSSLRKDCRRMIVIIRFSLFLSWYFIQFFFLSLCIIILFTHWNYQWLLNICFFPDSLPIGWLSCGENTVNSRMTAPSIQWRLEILIVTLIITGFFQFFWFHDMLVMTGYSLLE